MHEGGEDVGAPELKGKGAPVHAFVKLLKVMAKHNPVWVQQFAAAQLTTPPLQRAHTPSYRIMGRPSLLKYCSPGNPLVEG